MLNVILAVLLQIGIAASALCVLYFTLLGITLFISASKGATIFYTKNNRNWNVWVGSKITSTKVDVIKMRGNIFQCLAFIIQS